MSDSDRWGATPIDDARKFGHTAVTEYLEKSLADWDSAFGSSQVKIRKTIHRTLTFEISLKNLKFYILAFNTDTIIGAE